MGMRLLLFDIDGTLIRSHSAGRMALRQALQELFGTAGPIDSYRMSGKTDRRIVTDLLLAAGFSAEEIEARLAATFAKLTEKSREIFPFRDIIPCPGALALLERLRRREDVLLGLLTGNIESTAPLKLQAAGIDPLQFKVGAFGSEAVDRNDLLDSAMNRANQLTKCKFAGNNTIIIGDTPADILCARSGKATAVAVASGWHSTSTLAKYQPDHLLDNLADTTAVMSVLLDGELRKE
jgi:phosphoglycolate phosphatase